MREITIWDNYDIDINDENWKDFFDEEYPDADEDDRYSMAVEMNNGYFEDEKANLDLMLPENIVIFGDLGLWHGRRSGYKEIGNNLAGCLQFEKDCDYASWKVDKKSELVSRQSHHDGTNFFTYRRWRDGITEEQKDDFYCKFTSGKASSRCIGWYTKPLGKEVRKIYGFS